MLAQSDLKKLQDIVGLKYDPNNPFSTNSFFEEFNKKIPHQISSYQKAYRDKLILSSHSIEESEKLYFNGFIEWEKIDSGKKRSHENLEKTRLLFPKRYNQIKDRNVSIRYSSIKSKKDFLD